MIKTFPLRELCRQAKGEYVLGAEDLETHACYLIYGELKSGETGRRVCPGRGHEEILMAVVGDLVVEGDWYTGVLQEGDALHLKEEEFCTISNLSDSAAVYVLAGGHSGKPH